MYVAYGCEGDTRFIGGELYVQLRCCGAVRSFAKGVIRKIAYAAFDLLPPTRPPTQKIILGGYRRAAVK